jgi:hypothetical protein
MVTKGWSMRGISVLIAGVTAGPGRELSRLLAQRRVTLPLHGHKLTTTGVACT